MQCAAFLCLCVTTVAGALSGKPKVIVLSLGGYGHEFLLDENNEFTSAMREFKAEFAGPEYVMPVFPTKGSVNHVSIATGFYAEDHGVIDDCKYDEPGDQCKYGQPDTTKFPIWIENQMQGGTSAVMDWPGAEKEYAGKTPYYYQNFEDDFTRERFEQINERINTIFKWLQDEIRPANLVMVYYGALDKVFHENSAHDEVTKQNEFKLVELFVRSLVWKLTLYRIGNYVNVIILGSHGVHALGGNGGIRLNEIFSIQNICTFNAMGTNAIVTPSRGRFDIVYDILMEHAQTNGITKYRVYKYGTIRNGWHLKNSVLLKNKIFLVANLDYFFWNEDLEKILKKRLANGKTFETSLGGYSEGSDQENVSIKTIFMAKGPRFEPKKKVANFYTIDIYPLLRELLKLTVNANVRKRVEEMNRDVRGLLIDPPSTS